MNKYGARRGMLDGYNFDSQAELDRYCELKLLQTNGEISRLEVHPKFKMSVNGVKICTYIADFQYVRDDRMVVEDVKGVRTQVYRIKAKLMKAINQIDVVEVPA